MIFGPEVVQMLCPRPRPWRLVDAVVQWDEGLHAMRPISANEAVFAGHFPNVALWPGVHTIEGLVQSTRILGRLNWLADSWERDAVVDALSTAHRARRMAPKVDQSQVEALVMRLGHAPAEVGYEVDIKLLAPVYAGCVLHYHVAPRRLGFAVEARVDERCVARGTVR